MHLIHCTCTLYDTFVGAKSSYPSSGLVESLCTHFKLDTSVHVVIDKKILKEGRNRNVYIVYPYLLCTGYSFVELIATLCLWSKMLIPLLYRTWLLLVLTLNVGFVSCFSLISWRLMPLLSSFYVDYNWHVICEVHVHVCKAFLCYCSGIALVWGPQSVFVIHMFLVLCSSFILE